MFQLFIANIPILLEKGFLQTVYSVNKKLTVRILHQRFFLQYL
ncbi:MAG: hypothetical protein JWM14_2711 [Chitinophagaceae bacterium]|nr:hypothetical protein [Chitinophagaceae bacterium]